jgi:hypothetical protein
VSIKMLVAKLLNLLKVSFHNGRGYLQEIYPLSDTSARSSVDWNKSVLQDDFLGC